jgi:hypothetical protein
MERSPTEASSHSVTLEFPKMLRNPKFYYRVHKIPPLVPIQSQMNPVHTTPSYSLKSILIPSSHLRLGLPSGITKYCNGFAESIAKQRLDKHPATEYVTI